VIAVGILEDESAAYPVFTDDQLDRLRGYGSVRQVRAGEVLFSPADDTYDLLVVLDGEVEVTEEVRGGRVRFAPHGRGQFVGELNLLTGQRPFHTARVMTDGEILDIPPDQLRALLDRETEIADVLVRALIARRRRRVSTGAASAPIEVIGTEQSAPTLALRTFLGRNTIAYRWVDADRVAGLDGYLSAVGVTRDDLPVVITPGSVLPRARPADLGAALGLVRHPSADPRYDVLVVGAGPAGLAAAVYGASEGLDVAVFDGTAPGGQAGTSSRIENYLGFPDGISGAELTTRAAIQAQRFGALLTSPCEVERLSVSPAGFEIMLSDGGSAEARTVVAACGARYRRLPLANWERLEGAGIYYAATALEGLCSDSPVFVLGGGNSAGQAALFLARRCPRVTIVIRRHALAASMSQYLIDRIEAHDRIDLAASSVVSAVNGRDHLESVELRDTRSGQIRRFGSRGLFCFIGAEPASGWLPAEVARDEDGFVLTDTAVPPGQTAGRPRLPYETALDGLFAAGDIRVGSMKRVAAAVGEGSSAIRSVHQYLALFADHGIDVPARLSPPDLVSVVSTVSAAAARTG
jgi:thioredoxin reductase (NADPH)